MEEPPRAGHPTVRDRVDAATRWSRARAEDARAAAERARGRSRVVALGFDLGERDRARLGGLLAGALAYRMFLWLLPFSLLLVGVLGGLTSLDDGLPNDISKRVGLRGFLGDSLNDGARQSGWWLAIVIGLFGTLYAGLGVVRALHVAHAAAWGLRPSRPRKAAKGSLWLAAIAIALLVVAGLIGWLRNVSFIGGLVALLAMTGVYFVLWVAVSSRLPHRGVPARALMPGALVLAVGIEGLQVFTAYYLAGRAQRAASLYGTIGAALTLLLWLFIVARLMVGGAILNAELTRGHDDAEEAR